MRDQSQLGRQVRSAAGWSYVGSAIRTGCQFALTLVLARLLGPEPYALVAIAGSVLLLGNLIHESGLGAALIQKESIDARETAQAQFWQVMIGLGCFAVLALAAYPAEWFLRLPGLGAILIVTAAIFPIQALSHVPAALLKRNLRFKALQAINLVSYIAAYVFIALPLAILAGAGAWSIVAGMLAQSCLSTVAYILAAKYRPTLAVQAWPRHLTRFSAHTLVNNFATWAATNAETFILGRLGGAVALGSYNRIQAISVTIAGSALSPISPVLFSYFSRIAAYPAKIHLAVKRLSLLSVLPGIGLTAVACLAHGFVVPLLLGEKWQSTSHLLVPLGVAVIPLGVVTVVSPALLAAGRPDIEWSTTVIVGAISVPFLILAAGNGLEAFAWTATGAAALKAAVLAARYGLFQRASPRGKPIC